MRAAYYCILPAILAGCTISGPTANREAEPPSVRGRTAITAVEKSNRPLPHPLYLPPAFDRAIANGTRTNDGRPGSRYWLQHEAYVLEARIFPEERRLDGSGRIRYTNNAPNPLQLLRIELTQNLHAEGALRFEQAEVTGGVTLSRVAVNGQTLQPNALLGEQDSPGYTVQGTQLIVAPRVALDPGATAEIEIEWSFGIPQAGASGRMGYDGDDLLYLAYWYPKMAVYDDVYGWSTDPFTGIAEFYHGFADYEVTIEAPEGWVVAATGVLQNPDDVLAPGVAARMRAAYESDTPMQIVGPEDFASATRSADGGQLRWAFRAGKVRDVAFSVTRASIWDAARTPVGDRDGDGTTDYAAINTFYRESAPRWQQATRYQQHAIAFHSSFTGLPYPWPHMTAVEAGGIIGGGMEYPMMTLMGDYNTRGDSALYWVTSHELAHMWIPMIVGTNERRFSWMDEGSTSFLENQSRYDIFPGSNHDEPDRQNYLDTARKDQEGEMMRRSNFHYTSEAFGTASYGKPATLLVALRSVLGEATFMEGYRAFIRDWAYKHPYPFDLFNTFERVSGRDLDWFWHSWYYETWTLDQAVASVAQSDGTARIVIMDFGNVPMPVRLKMTYEDGSTNAIVLPVDEWLEGKREMTATIATDALITRVEIDAERHFPDIERGNNVWTR